MSQFNNRALSRPGKFFCLRWLNSNSKCFSLNIRSVITIFIALLLILSCLLNSHYAVTNNLIATKYQNLLKLRSPLVSLFEYSMTGNCSNRHSLVLVREFFVSSSSTRNKELEQAITVTHHENPCAILVFVISQTDHLESLIQMNLKLQANIKVYWSPVTVTMDRLFRAAYDSSKPDTIFAVSTADVAIASLSHLVAACPSIFREEADELIVVSRRDYNGRDCLAYYEGSWDVYIAAATLLTESKFDQMIVSPTYWGVENIMAWVLAQRQEKVYNMCPYIDVLHYHSYRQNQRARIRLNHNSNTVNLAAAKVEASCDLDILKENQHIL